MPYKNQETRRKKARERYKLNPEKQIKKTNDRRKKLNEWYKDYKKGLRCCRCGENHPACLEFHHKSNKSINVATMMTNGCSIKRILEEIKKCIVLCSNCHRKKHYVGR